MDNEKGKSVSARKKRDEFLRKFRANHMAASNIMIDETIYDPYQAAEDSLSLVRKATGYTYEEVVNCHECLWDENYPERPQRLSTVYDRDLGLLDRCRKLTVTNCDEEDILRVHTEDLLNKLKTICLTCKTIEELETASSDYDAIYFNKNTFEAAKLALSAALEVSLAVGRQEIQNGFALIRPPGHHAMTDEFNGYCIFNNIAICAERLLKEKLAKRILIVDYDVHHGQGVQKHFYDRNDVLYFSIHRYEYGTFWPNLEESAEKYIGNGSGLGYNINVPLNDTGLGDVEYLAIVFNILLPVAYEFNPDIVLIASGFDGAWGDPEGLMKVTPKFYGHLITMLSGLAKGKIVVYLEGGYFNPSLAEGAAQTLSSLLGDPCPPLEPFRTIHPTVIDTILNLGAAFDALNNHIVMDKYCGEEFRETKPFLTRNCYPTMDSVTQNQNMLMVLAQSLHIIKPDNTETEPKCVGYFYDDYMMKHSSRHTSYQPETPQRIEMIYKMMQENGLTERMKEIKVGEIPDQPFFDVHNKEYMSKIFANVENMGEDLNFGKDTAQSSLLAAAGLFHLAREIIVSKNIKYGVGIVRPPGHHAGPGNVNGFCYLNNVVILANYLLNQYSQSVKRVLIVDFDIHHGDGTQKLTYNRKDIMYISVHRYDHGRYFPSQPDADFEYTGTGAGVGYNVNIPFNNEKMGDVDYMKIFHELILPIAYSYGPNFLIISAGFDAAINDPLGKGYTLSPEIYGHFVNLLKSVASDKLIVALEGGYNLQSTTYGMMMIIKALLGDPIPLPNLTGSVKEECLNTIRNVVHTHKYHWPILQVKKSVCDWIMNDEEKENFIKLVGKYRRCNENEIQSLEEQICKFKESKTTTLADAENQLMAEINKRDKDKIDRNIKSKELEDN